jgi:hypothetical protein
MLEGFDKHISVFTESLARKLDRRKMIRTSVTGLFTTVAAVTVGQLTNVGQAFAATCTCDNNWTNGHPCNTIGHACPSNGCPSGCSVCHNNDCGGWCNWSSGHWVSCSHQGASGKGYRLCWDCKCTTCKHKCSCLSSCINC